MTPAPERDRGLSYSVTVLPPIHDLEKLIEQMDQALGTFETKASDLLRVEHADTYVLAKIMQAQVKSWKPRIQTIKGTYKL